MPAKIMILLIFYYQGKNSVAQREFSSSTCRYGLLHCTPANDQFSSDSSQPIAVVYAWLLAKSRHLDKIGKLYNDHGVDVVTVKPNVAEVCSFVFSHWLGTNFFFSFSSKEFELRHETFWLGIFPVASKIQLANNSCKLGWQAKWAAKVVHN